MTRLHSPLWLAGGLLATLGCATANQQMSGAPAPGFSFPARLPETAQGATASVDESATPTSETPKQHQPNLPDPSPLMLERQWEYEILYDHGHLSLTRTRPLLFEKPVATARRMGRYAVELWIGRELIDRVRFDFPGLAAETPPSGPRRPLDEPPSLAAKAVVSRKILVPASPRATRAELVDRATGERISLPWPPDAPLAPIAPAPDREPVKSDK